jgi:predicted dinucleotide-binding enzyme
MTYKTYVSMNIAVIGSGDTAIDYATGFACAGHEVYLASKDGDKAVTGHLAGLFEHIHACSISDAADVADMILVATEPKDVREVAYWLGDVRRRVIIDATANVDAADEDFVRTATGLQAITGSPHIIKVFNTTGYEQLLQPIFKSKKAELVLAGDSKKAKEIIKIMAIELGIKSCYDFGGSDTILLFNEMTRCWRHMGKKSGVVSAGQKALKS